MSRATSARSAASRSRWSPRARTARPRSSCPPENCAEAKERVPGGLQLIKIQNLQGRGGRVKGPVRWAARTSCSRSVCSSAVVEFQRQLRVLDHFLSRRPGPSRGRAARTPPEPSRSTAATRRASRRSGCSAATRAQHLGVLRLVAAVGQLGLRRPAAAPRSPAPARNRAPSRSHFDGRASASATSSLGSGTARSGSARSPGWRLTGQLRLLVQQLGGGRRREQQRRLVPAGPRRRSPPPRGRQQAERVCGGESARAPSSHPGGVDGCCGSPVPGAHLYQLTYRSGPGSGPVRRGRASTTS